MIRAIIGLVIGGICGFGMVYLISFFQTAAYGHLSRYDLHDLTLGTLLSGVWALAGAVVGATGDVLAFLRRVYPREPRATLEADYRELRRPAS
jgi:hypothetical protein